jgi:hypothetical protein
MWLCESLFLQNPLPQAFSLRRRVGVSQSCFADISHPALHHVNTDPNYG